jgi:cell wall-associated NlpC family hydrolase
MAGLEDFIGALGARLGGTLSGASPFHGDPRMALSPFMGALNAVQSPFRNGLAVQSPFQGRGFNVESPFQGRGFNVPSPFGGTFNVGTPFGNSPISGIPIFNPFAPKPATNTPGTVNGGLGGGPSTGLAPGVAKWAQQAQSTFADLGADMPDIMLAIMTNESGGNPAAKNPGYPAYGLFQLVGYGSNLTPEQQFTSAHELAQQKLAGISTSYKAHGLNPDARTRARDFALAWAGHFDYSTGLPNTSSADIVSGQTAAQLSDIFLRNYDAIKNGRAQGTGIGGQGGGGQYRGSAAVQRAESLVGTPYVLGGLRGHPNQPALGLDCSEFTGWALGLDASLWRAQTQYDRSTKLTQKQAREGDLVFFTATDPSNPNEYITHVGLYLGNGRFINAQDGGVMEADVNSSYWRAHLAGFGRL